MAQPDKEPVGSSAPSGGPAPAASSSSKQEVGPSSQRPPRARHAPSMWTAPQSHIPPPSPTHYVEPRRAETFFRRVTHPSNPNGPPPSRWQRAANLSGGLLAGAVVLYSVLWADFGNKEHVFSPIRRALNTQTYSPFALSEEERTLVAQSVPRDDKTTQKMV